MHQPLFLRKDLRPGVGAKMQAGTPGENRTGSFRLPRMRSLFLDKTKHVVGMSGWRDRVMENAELLSVHKVWMRALVACTRLMKCLIIWFPFCKWLLHNSNALLWSTLWSSSKTSRKKDANHKNLLVNSLPKRAFPWYIDGDMSHKFIKCIHKKRTCLVSPIFKVKW